MQLHLVIYIIYSEGNIVYEKVFRVNIPVKILSQDVLHQTNYNILN